jgi:thiamine biosynthesis lipoprotein
MTTEPVTAAAAERLEVCLLGQRTFRAMNTTIELYSRDLEDVGGLTAAEDLFHVMEARLSRFIPGSELCQLNERSGQEVVASDVLFDVLEWALKLHRVTGGAFEPAILPHLEAAGYDRSFEKVPRQSDDPPGVDPDGQLHSIAHLRLDRVKKSVQTPAGMRLDLGGIGKGYTVDAASRLLESMRDFVVNAGGDIYASGCGPDGDGWLVAVTDPTVAGQSISFVRLYDEALATSTIAVRKWRRDGKLQHHLIDPRTRRPAESGVLSVSVVARTATEADVFAKTAFLLGPDDGARFLEEQDASGLFVLEAGEIVPTANWAGTPAG